MLKNRVDPFGNIIMTAAHGAYMGNRGILHDDKKEIVRTFKLNAWITCKLEFKGRKRQVMAPNRYTELFFMDEATSFSAGHRPCFECRREDHKRFKTAWLKGNPGYGFIENTAIKEIDHIIHQERISKGRLKVMYDDALEHLPDGTFIMFNHEPHLLRGGFMYVWSPFGYKKGAGLPAADQLQVLTPRSVVNAFRAGYIPQMAV